MTHPFSTIYLAVTGIFFVGSGLLAAARPEQFAANLDLAPIRAGGFNEVRAQYGGFFTLLGLTCALGAAGYVDPRFALGAAALTFGGVIAGRVLGLAIDRSIAGYGRTVRTLILVDAAGCALAIAGLITGA
jgi:hypothetical protein